MALSTKEAILKMYEDMYPGYKDWKTIKCRTCGEEMLDNPKIFDKRCAECMTEGIW